MHEIQLDILKRITTCPKARYSDLKSEDIDGNLFMYHLNQLIGEGYIQKSSDKNYTLTEYGKSFINLLSTDEGKTRKQPQILIMLYGKNEAGQILLFRWSREPNVDLVSLPHGNMHFGVSPITMAASELKEKCNSEGKITFRGDIYLTVWSNKQVFNQMLCHLFEVSELQGDLLEKVKNGSSFWGKIDDFTETELWPGTWEILEVIEKNQEKIFFEEIEALL